MPARREELRRRLQALGFDEVRFACAGDPPAGALHAWLAAGYHAGMDWLPRTAEKRSSPPLVLPGVRTVIALGVNYWSAGRERPGARRNGSAAVRHAPFGGNPVWARYALHEDYHDTIKPALVAAGRVLEEFFGVDGGAYRYYVDTGPVLERGWAARAGLGFLGKNAMLISQVHGNWLLLAAILTRVDIEPDAPLSRSERSTAGGEEPVGLRCGKCRRCLDACPTGAFPRPGVVDARRCISYQTIENKGHMPRDLRAGIGDRIYGCDACLEVCPWNRFAREGRRMLLAARHDLAALGLGEILELTPERFAEVFRRTPVKRLKLARLQRNACVVAGNMAAGGGPLHELLAPLVRLAAHESPLVRAHAVWAVYRIAGHPAAGQLLHAAREAERDESVNAEYAAGSGAP
ncbi:MAG: tRNA epoxyqueuosine(34) reductase QueG [Opitutaceae bacterium]|nr:tRNA epoxyqueuosine(34) reductase QueG [Opitutaceae bacterium]